MSSFCENISATAAKISSLDTMNLILGCIELLVSWYGQLGSSYSPGLDALCLQTKSIGGNQDVTSCEANDETPLILNEEGETQVRYTYRVIWQV